MNNMPFGPMYPPNFNNYDTNHTLEEKLDEIIKKLENIEKIVNSFSNSNNYNMNKDSGIYMI